MYKFVASIFLLDCLFLITNKAKDAAKGIDVSALKRAGILDEVYTLKQFMSGLLQKMKGDGASIKKVERRIHALEDALEEMVGSVTSQLILSISPEKSLVNILENFAYWNIPNMMAEDPAKSIIEVLIKKDPQKIRIIHFCCYSDILYSLTWETEHMQNIE